MAKQKTEKLNFSKFFPKSTAYVSVSGNATASDDFNIDVKIGDGNESISLYTTDWFKDDGLATLKAIQEGITKAIEFQQKALKLPKGDKVFEPHWAIWDQAVVSNGVKEAKQKAAAKKAAKK
jgi:hypothetical protein